MHIVHRLAATLFVSLAVASNARAEMVEEIIAWVNGDIITRSEYEMQLQAQRRPLERNRLRFKLELLRPSLEPPPQHPSRYRQQPR